MEAATKMKVEVDYYKKRLVEKVEEARQLLKEKVPDETELFLRNTSQVLRVLDSRVNSFSDNHMKFQGMAETDDTGEADKLFKLDGEANRALIDETRELIGGITELRDSLRENEKRALEKELKFEKLKQETAQSEATNKLDAEKAALEKELKLEKLKHENAQAEATQKLDAEKLALEREKTAIAKGLDEKKLQVEADRVRQAAELERKHQDFVQSLEKEKAAQTKDFANRQQEIEMRHREKEAAYTQELEQAKLHANNEDVKGGPAPLGAGRSRPSSVKLPKLEFPMFYGDVTKWKEFWDCFNAAIHSNSRLATIDKLNYLRSRVAGEALGVIRGLPLTEENYDVSIELRKGRYADNSRILKAHYAALRTLQKASQTTDKCSY